MDEQVVKNIVAQVVKLFPDVVPHLQGEAGHIYCESKAIERDPQEPGREEKMRTERKIKSVIGKRFERQKQAITRDLEANYKVIIGHGVFVDDDASEYNALVQIFYASILEGVTMAETGVGFALGDGTVNQQALQYAQSYTTEFLNGLDSTTQATLQQALSMMPSGTGATIGDIVNLLDPVFGLDRALRIAVTETTRIYAEANQMFANQLAAQYPGFEVVKRYFTNVDDRVCPLCRPLDGKVAPYDDDFAIPNPPLHPNCRCWTSVTVRA